VLRTIGDASTLLGPSALGGLQASQRPWATGEPLRQETAPASPARFEPKPVFEPKPSRFPDNLDRDRLARSDGGSRMRRREFVAGLGSAAAWTVVARAQQRAAEPLIGWLSSRTAATDALVLPALHRALMHTASLKARTSRSCTVPIWSGVERPSLLRSRNLMFQVLAAIIIPAHNRYRVGRNCPGSAGSMEAAQTGSAPIVICKQPDRSP
jgi:hypothetical protein